MKWGFTVENVKCGGCVNAIQTGLRQDQRVREVTVDIPTGRVTVDVTTGERSEWSAALKALGYPERA